MSEITLEEATDIANQLNLDLNKIPIDEFRKAMQIELEHGTNDPITNVTNNDLLMTGKIALAHINEFPDYYDRLEVLEEEANTYWEKKVKPNIYRQNLDKCQRNYRWSVWLTFILVVLIYAYWRG